MDDAALLQAYVRDGSEIAFREIVSRHIALVYSAALRQLNESTLAEDVSQVVFITLARKAGELPSGTMLAGWLYRTTRFVAARMRRTDQRRRQREQFAAQMQISAPEARWEQLAPFLDEGMGQLGDLDRGAVLLRYFKNRSLREVGRALGISEDAAQKRVSRAIEKLRTSLCHRHGLAVSALTLTSLLSTNAAQLAPSHLTAAVIAACSQRAVLSTPVYGLLEQALEHAVPHDFWPKLAAPVSAAVTLVAAVFLVLEFWPRGHSEVVSWKLDSRIVSHPRPPAARPTAPAAEPSPPTIAASPTLRLDRLQPSAAMPATNPAPAVVAPTNEPIFTAAVAIPTNAASFPARQLGKSPARAQNPDPARGRAAPPAPPPGSQWSYYPNYRVGQGVIFMPAPPVYYTRPPPPVITTTPRLVAPGMPRGRLGPPQKGI